MSVGTSRKILKVTGILGIIFGVIGIIFGVLALTGGGMAAQNLDVSNGEHVQVVGAIFLGGIVAIVTSIISLIEGICSVRAANDSSKIMPAWIFAILGIITTVCNVFGNFSADVSAIVGAVLSLALSVLVFMAANTIKKANS